MGLLRDLMKGGMFGVAGLALSKGKKKKPAASDSAAPAESGGPMATGQTVGIAAVRHGADFTGGFKAKAQAIEDELSKTKIY